MLYYDLADDGSILYTNGDRVYALVDKDSRPEQISDGKFIEQLAVIR